MEKHLVDRRVEQMEQEGVVFHYDVNVGVDMAVEELVSAYDAVLLAGGARPRAIWRSRAAILTACISRWSFCRSRTKGFGEPPIATRRSWPPESMSW